MMQRPMVAALAGLALAACQSAPPAGQRLSAAQIHDEFVGFTASGRSSDGGEFAVYNAPDGRLKLKTSATSDVGSYRISADGQWCMRFKVTFNGNENCAYIYKDGPTYRSVAPDGAVNATYSLSKGNSGNL